MEEESVEREIKLKLRKVHPDIGDEVDIDVVRLEPEIEIIASVKPEYEEEYEDLEETFSGADLELVKGEFAGWWFDSKKHAEMLFPTKLKGVTVKTTDEIRKMLEKMGAVTTESPREFVLRMIESGNRVLGNPYGTPVVEVVGLKEHSDDIEEIVNKWDINPAGHGVIPQPPSFSERYPSISEGLVAFQFMLEDREDLRSSGYDLKNMLSELEDKMVLVTKAPSVAPRLPF